MSMNPISPLRQQPIAEGQIPAFFKPILSTSGPLAMTVTVSLLRAPRQKCTVCGMKRIGYRIGLGDFLMGPVMCAKCAGIR